MEWKIGDSDGIEDSLQLLSYALGAIDKYGCSATDIDLYRIHLGDSKISHFEVCERKLLNAKARIIQDMEKMQSLDGYGRDAVAVAFTPCGQPRVCVLCPFQEVCTKE